MNTLCCLPVRRSRRRKHRAKAKSRKSSKPTKNPARPAAPAFAPTAARRSSSLSSTSLKRARPDGERRRINKSVSFDADDGRIPRTRLLRRYSTRGQEPTHSILRPSLPPPPPPPPPPPGQLSHVAQPAPPPSNGALDTEYMATQTVTTLTDDCEWMSACSHLDGWNDEWADAEAGPRVAGGDDVTGAALNEGLLLGREELAGSTRSGTMASSTEEYSLDEGAADDNEFLEIVRAWRRLKMVGGEIDASGFIAGLQANMLVVDALGAAFRLIKRDVDMNCAKISDACRKESVSTIHGILDAEKGKGPGTSAIRWMKRMLQFTYIMFSEYYTGRELPDSANLAYRETLHDCHPALVRNLARGIRLVVPHGATFSARLDPSPVKVENGVYDFLDALCPQLDILVSYFNEKGYEPVEKCRVPPKKIARKVV